MANAIKGDTNVVFGSLHTDANGTVNELQTTILGKAVEQLDLANATKDGVKADIAEIAARIPELAFPPASPVTPDLNVDTGVDFQNPTLGLSDFGDIRGLTATLGSLGAISTPEALSIDAFAPSVTSLNIPEAPTEAAAVTPPSKPATYDVTMPTAPTITKPALPNITDIAIPEFNFPTIDTFNATAPEFQDTAVSTVLQWAEPTYVTEVMDDVVAKLRELWAGGSGIPAAVEYAMWERAAGREDLDIDRQVSAAFTEFSSRGFTSPPGMLAARTDAIREEGQIKKQGQSREIAIRMAEMSVENMRFAVEQGIAAENVLFNIWNNMAARMFETAKIQLDSQLALYNARIALFNAGQQAYGVEAEVYRSKLQAQLATIDVFKAELDGAKTLGELNTQRVQMYNAQVDGLKTDIDIYDSSVRAALGQTEVNKTLIEGYRVDVQAYAETINVDRNRYDAYKTRVQGELGKAQLLDSEAKAYSSYVSGQAVVADINIKQMEADIARNAEVFRKFEADLAAEKLAVESDAKAIISRVQAYTADTQRVSAEAGVEESKGKLKIAGAEAQIRATIGIFDVEVRKYIADMEQVIQRASVQIEALKSTGQVGATLAAGAMAGINLGANISGNASVSVGRTNSDNNSANYNYEGI